ncbi:hypothetical protein HAX54_044358 [Datura stramonium]|uniref:Uncharacterized protein n=1 Tax=Datura stramonium TaxID=4076 RepID=A0ABS8W6L9_DATST|nr:hypothetical protein [Datura stramonium]
MQPAIRTEDMFLGLAHPRGIMTLCPSHCSTCVAQGIRDLTQHLTGQAGDSHAPPVSAFPKAPLSFKRIPGMSSLGKIVGILGSPRVPSSEISGEEDQVGPCEQLDSQYPFNPLSEMRQNKRKKNPWTDPIISTP